MNVNQIESSVMLNSAEVLLAQKTSRSLKDVLDGETEYHFQLLQEDKPSQIFAIPAPAMQLLVQMLTEMGQGNTVALTPVEQEITTQQAADMLSVSRPYLVLLLERGEIPFRKVGPRRRIRLQDLLLYKHEIETKRHETLNELTAYDQELGLQ